MAGRIKKEKTREIIRRRGLLKRESQSKGEIKVKSELIKKTLFAQREFKKSKIIMFYVSKFGEVETRGMIRESLKLGKKIVVPKICDNELIPCEIKNCRSDLQPGAFGIKEPRLIKAVPLDKLDLIIVPGICFDFEKNRLGYGKGYFDRFLTGIRKNSKIIGLSFELQLENQIPCLSHDKKLDKVITEKQVIE